MKNRFLCTKMNNIDTKKEVAINQKSCIFSWKLKFSISFEI